MSAGVSVITINGGKRVMKCDEERIMKYDEERKSNGGRTVAFWLLTAALIVILFLCMGGTAHSMEKKSPFDPAMKTYFKSVETEFVSEVKGLLKAEGYEYAGVMLTKRTSEDGSRVYKLNIHHRRFNDERKADMEQKIRNIELDIPDSVLNVTFD